MSKTSSFLHTMGTRSRKGASTLRSVNTSCKCFMPPPPKGRIQSPGRRVRSVHPASHAPGIACHRFPSPVPSCGFQGASVRVISPRLRRASVAWTSSTTGVSGQGGTACRKRYPRSPCHPPGKLQRAPRFSASRFLQASVCRSSRRTASCVRFRHQRRSTRACMAGCSCSSAVSGKARHPLSCRCKKRCSASSSMDCSCACNRAADAIRADAPGDSASSAGRISSRRRLRRHCACALVLSSRQLSPASSRASRSAARDNPSNGRASVTPPRRLRGRMPASPSGPVPRSRCSSRVSA